MSAGRYKRVDDGLSYGCRHVAGRAAQVEVAVLATQVVVDHLRVLGDAVLYVDLVRLVARERRAEHAQHALAARVVILELVSVREVRAPVARAEEERHWADALAARAGHLAVLHHGAERRDARAEADHDARMRVRLGDGDAGAVDARRDQVDGRAVATQRLQVVGAQADVVGARRRRPVVLHDAQVQHFAVHLARRRDRVQARLDARDVVEQVVERQLLRRVARQQVGVRDRLVRQLAQLAVAVLRQHPQQLLAVRLVVGGDRQRLVEAPTRLAEHVEHLGEELRRRDDAGQRLLAVLRVLEANERLGADAELVAEAEHALAVVVRVDAEAVADVVLHARAGQVELVVADVAVVVVRGEQAVLDERNQLRSCRVREYNCR